jgi:IS30 family transposase
LHTITGDNNKEFAEHERIAQELDFDFFFAIPYAAWERSSNENMNGLIRQYIPKIESSLLSPVMSWKRSYQTQQSSKKMP